mgnify:CR=1 FL=1
MMLCEKSPGKPMHVWALCMWTAIVFGLCLLSLACEAAPVHIRIQPEAIRPGMILPGMEDACVEGALRAPIFVQDRQGPKLSLNTLQVTFAMPSFASPWGHILTTGMTVGRQRIQWGPGITGGLVLSDRASLDGLTFHLVLDRIRYTQVQAGRDFATGKWLLAHRLEGQAFPNLKIGISEAIAVSGGFRMRFAHLVPAFPYYLIQHLTIKGDREQDRWTNALVSVDASVNLRDNLVAYAEFMADDFPWAMSAKGRVPHMVGGVIGIRLTRPLHLADGAPVLMTCIGELLKGAASRDPVFETSQGKRDTLDTYCSVTAEYVRINNYVYSHKNPDNTYITRTGQLIGHPLGPDAEGVYLILAANSYPGIQPGNQGQATLFFGYERHGEGAPGEPWRPSHGTGREFLSGIVETRKVLGMSAGVDILPVAVDPGQATNTDLGHEGTHTWSMTQPNASLELSLKIESMDNAGHIPGAKALEGNIAISVRLHYGHPSPNP